MTKKDKILILGIVAVGGYLLFFNKPQASATVINPIGDGTDPALPPPPPPPVYDSGLSTEIIDVITTHDNQTALTTAYNTIYSLPATNWPGWGATQKVMEMMRNNGDLADLQAISMYITNFLSKGVPLSRSVDNAALYDKIISIHNTYGIF